MKNIIIASIVLASAFMSCASAQTIDQVVEQGRKETVASLQALNVNDVLASELVIEDGVAKLIGTQQDYSMVSAVNPAPKFELAVITDEPVGVIRINGKVVK